MLIKVTAASTSQISVEEEVSDLCLFEEAFTCNGEAKPEKESQWVE